MKLYSTLINLGLMLAATTFLPAEEAAPAAEKQTTVQLDETYINKDTGYSISYPKNWQKKDIPRLDITLIAPKEPHAEMHASMNVISEKVGPSVTLDEFYNESLKQLQAELKGVHVDQSSNRKFGDASGKSLVYTHAMGDIKLKVAQYFVIGNNTVYLITFSAIDKDFEDYKPEFDAIVGSFKLLPSTEATQSPKAKQTAGIK